MYNVQSIKRKYIAYILYVYTQTMSNQSNSSSRHSSRSSFHSSLLKTNRSSRRTMARQSRIEFQKRQMLAQGHDGSGRDTFIMFAPHGTDKPGSMYTPGRKIGFEGGLRGSANYISTPSREVKLKNKIGRRRGVYKKQKSLFDKMLEKGMAFGSAANKNSTNYNAGTGVAGLISGGKEHQIEEHLAPGRRAIHAKRPKSASAIRHRMARTYMIRRNISCYKNAGKGVDPKNKRRDEFIKRSRERQDFAKDYERHTCGRVFVGRKDKVADKTKRPKSANPQSK